MMEENQLINEYVISQIEAEFGFKLYDWQKDYLLDKAAIPSEIWISRRTGTSFIHIVKQLLNGYSVKEVPLDIHPCAQYKNWFRQNVQDINTRLIRAGVLPDENPIIPKLDYMQLWFYNWLMLDKEYPIDKIVRLSNEEYKKETQLFVEMYQNIK
ncbi:MAG: hypothetical protein PHS74_00370 [Lachnospiraceae bacterium]|nr:hypothetical protein [Lachnospiraceae bacterium]